MAVAAGFLVWQSGCCRHTWKLKKKKEERGGGMFRLCVCTENVPFPLPCSSRANTKLLIFQCCGTQASGGVQLLVHMVRAEKEAAAAMCKKEGEVGDRYAVWR
jgi:hypothetical protein